MRAAETFTVSSFLGAAEAKGDKGRWDQGGRDFEQFAMGTQGKLDAVRSMAGPTILNDC
jgi:hypothetical protein